MVRRKKIENYILILLKMYCKKFSNTSGNVLKVVTNKDCVKFSEWYGNMYCKAHGNLRQPVVMRSMKAQEMPED